MGMQNWLAKIDYRDKVAATMKVFRWSSASIPPFPTSDPNEALQAYDAVIKSPGQFGRYLYPSGELFGDPRSEDGGVEIYNSNGELNFVRTDCGLDGRNCELYYGNTDFTNFNEYSLFLKGTIYSVVPSFIKGAVSTISIKVRDRSQNMKVPFQNTKYAGTNSGVTGVEGLATDIKGLPKVKAFGYIYNAPIVPVNTAALIYQLHHSSSGQISAITAVRDNGVALTLSANYATLVLLQASVPGAGNYATCLAEGYIKLGGNPAGQITADFEGDKLSGAFTYRVGEIIKRILVTDLGYTASDYVDQDFSDLNTDAPYQVGIFVAEETTYWDVFTELANSVGAAWYHDRQGKFRIKRLVDPVGLPPLLTITEDEIVDATRLNSNSEETSVPVYRALVGYNKNYATQTGDDLAGAVTPGVRAQLNLEYQYEPFENAAVKTDHLLSNQIIRNTLIHLRADATTEATRLQTLLGTVRDVLQITVKFDEDTRNIDLMSTINIESTKLGYVAGKKFSVIGISENNPRSNYRLLELFG